MVEWIISLVTCVVLLIIIYIIIKRFGKKPLLLFMLLLISLIVAVISMHDMLVEGARETNIPIFLLGILNFIYTFNETINNIIDSRK